MIAALLVVFFHVQDMVSKRLDSEAFATKFGGVGVDIFFVISGFIMMYSCYEMFGLKEAPLKFLKNRSVRIIPTYYLFTTLMVVLLIFAPSLFGSLKFDLWHVILSYLFILSEDNAGNVSTVLGVGWTLAFEMFFYLVFASLLRFPRKFFIPSIISIFILGNLIGLFVKDLGAWSTVFTSPITFEFLFGCLIGLYYKKGKSLGLKTSFGLVAIGTIWILATSFVWTIQVSLGYYRVFAFGIPSALFMLGFINIENNRKIATTALIKRIGDSSYSLYLIHSFVLTGFGVLIAPRLYNFGVPVFLIVAVTMVAAIIGGFACYYLFEKPVTKKLKKLRVNNNSATTEHSAVFIP
ncbi:hypothetical protein BSK47_31440 [Paenibacillus odorifer]|uniref:Acyltransferase 3 domain-containing protein n=2 Tax=Paenibacillus TaxID=44249 RepID=A0AB36J2P7_9BACL|nr:hypothetical protein BSK47_31440 [Paenibacillus odorifer]